ncbi:terpene synthase family protein [Crossiella cryophila]|uniref:Terpene synthase n=1 Tax=Crossiella cryophila TaxID=43355 RepID=A0A7W7CC41_9PSEU|nr:hypothetical protein [Crossiella cryophila]MBB4678390.1 hypothetical protein [Crossiella cryophila]
MRRFGMVRAPAACAHFDAIGAGRLSAWVYPEAALEVRGVVTDWLSWLFVIDDQCDEGLLGRDPVALDRLTGPVHQVLDGRRDDLPPLAAGLADICDRVSHLGPWWARYRDHVRGYLDACRWEAANRAAGRVPVLDAYLPHRRWAGSMLATLDLTELATGDLLTDQEWADPDYQQAMTAAADIVCWTDDVVAVDKEVARGDVHNLVIVLSTRHGIPWAEATRLAGDMLDRRVAEFLAAETRLLAADPARWSRNLHGLRAWMRGHLDWGAETARYREVDRCEGVPAYIEELLVG